MADFTEEDFDLSLSPVKKASVKQGRRAEGQEDEQSPTFEMAASPLMARRLSGDILMGDGAKEIQETAPPRRAGGWADENSRAKTVNSELNPPNDINFVK